MEQDQPTGRIDSLKKKFSDSLYEKNAITTVLAQVESKSGVERTKIVLGLIFLIAFYLMVGYGGDFLCNLIGFAYPAYKSIKAIESKTKDDDTKWLVYWVVYSLFLLLEYFTDLLLSWIPFYYLFKCIFLIYCMLPQPYCGSLFIYNRIIRPFFLKHQAAIDRGVEQVSTFGNVLAEEAKDVAKDTVSDVMKKHLE